jgi:hypothetical protein
VNFEIMADKSLQIVRMDVERFADALIDVLERLVGVEVHKIKISISSEDIWSTMRIEGCGSPSYNPFSGQPQRSTWRGPFPCAKASCRRTWLTMGQCWR